VECASGVSQEAISGTDPQSAAAIFREAADVVTGKSLVALLIEAGELHTVEAGHAPLGRDP
jgi:hypothetical protein